jgi:hypothetical protein
MNGNWIQNYYSFLKLWKISADKTGIPLYGTQQEKIWKLIQSIGWCRKTFYHKCRSHCNPEIMKETMILIIQRRSIFVSFPSMTIALIEHKDIVNSGRVALEALNHISSIHWVLKANVGQFYDWRIFNLPLYPSWSRSLMHVHWKTFEDYQCWLPWQTGSNGWKMVR